MAYKKAKDVDGKILGRIMRLDEHKLGSEKKLTITAMIESVKFLQGNVLVPVSLEKLISIEDEFVKFNITKSKFNATRKLIKNKISIEDEAFQKTEPARFLFFSNQSSVNITKRRKKE